MSPRQVLLSGVVLLLLTLLAIFLIDAPVAASIAPSAASTERAIHSPMTAIEIAFGFRISKFALGGAIVLAGLVLFPFVRYRRIAWLLLFVGVTHFITRLIAGVLKNVFLRKRPFEGSAEFFVDGGSAFPSGHAAHFWALFFALAIAFPRLRIPALILAVLVSLARVAVNDHYVGDVLASGAISAFVVYGFSLLLARRVPLRTVPGTVES
jgi:membrane-associated phospholipid phosphatase